MKIKTLAFVALLPCLTNAQSYHERFEPIKQQDHLLENFDLTGKVKEMVTEEFTKNKEGKYELAQYGSKEIYRFDQKGRLTEKIVVLNKMDSEVGDTFSKEYFTYNAQGLLENIRYDHYNSNDIYTYDKEGHLLSIENNGNNPSKRSFTYDAKGRLLTDECSNFKDEYKYEGNSDKVLSCTFNDSDKTFDLSGVITYAYWSNGNVKSKEMKRNDREHHFRDYLVTYTEEGKLSMISTGDTTNIDLNSGRTSYFYNDKGLLRHMNSYNVFLGEGDALSKTDFTYEFDKTGNWTVRFVSTMSSWDMDYKAKENWDKAMLDESKTVRTITYY